MWRLEVDSKITSGSYRTMSAPAIENIEPFVARTWGGAPPLPKYVACWEFLFLTATGAKIRYWEETGLPCPQRKRFASVLVVQLFRDR